MPHERDSHSRLAARAWHLGKKSCKPLLALLPGCSSWRDAVIFLFKRQALNKRLYPPAYSTEERCCRARSRTVTQELRRGDTVRAARPCRSRQGCPYRSALSGASSTPAGAGRDRTQELSRKAPPHRYSPQPRAGRQARATLTAAAPAANERPPGAAALLPSLSPLRSLTGPATPGLCGEPALGPPRCATARPGPAGGVMQRGGVERTAGPGPGLTALGGTGRVWGHR